MLSRNRAYNHRPLDPAVVNGSISLFQASVDGKVRELECDLADPNAWDTPECSMERLLPSGPERVTLGELLVHDPASL